MIKTLVLMVAILLMGAKAQVPRVLPTPFIPMKSNQSIVDIPQGQFAFYFTTNNGRLIPAIVDGVQFDTQRNIKGWRPTPGLKRTQVLQDYVVIYVSVNFRHYCELDKLVVIGPKGYRMEIDLDLFWGESHQFKSNESYAMCMYL